MPNIFQLLKNAEKKYGKISGLNRRVIPKLSKKLKKFPNQKLPDEGIGITQTTNRFFKTIEPGLSMSAGSRYWGYVTGGRTSAALMGDILSGFYDQNLIASGDSIAPYVEQQAISWTLDLVKLSREEFSGQFTTGATVSNLLGLACARQWQYKHMGINIAKQGLYDAPKLRIYAAAPHFSIKKAVAVLGLGVDSIQEIPLNPGTDIMNHNLLEEKLSQSKDAIHIVVAGAGKVTTGSFDNIAAISEICKQHKAWLHVDAAFGLFARCSKKHSHLTAGIENADSIATDAHKFLNVPYDSGLFFTKHSALQQEIFAADAPYLLVSSEYKPTKSLTPTSLQKIENSQRFRGLPVWMSLLAYGRKGYEKKIEKCCVLAEIFWKKLDELDKYELIAPISLNIVLFRSKLNSSKEFNEELLCKINDSGLVLMSQGVYANKHGIRAAICNFETTHADIEKVVDLVKQLSEEKNYNSYRSGNYPR